MVLRPTFAILDQFDKLRPIDKIAYLKHLHDLIMQLGAVGMISFFIHVGAYWLFDLLNMQPVIWFLLFLAPITILAPIACAMRAVSIIRKLGRLVTVERWVKTEDIPALLNCFQIPRWRLDLTTWSVQNLIAILPNSRHSDGVSLSSDQRRTLYRLLSVTVSDDLVLSVLAIVEDIGDWEAIPLLRALAAGKYAAIHNQRVHEGAVRCLAIVETRLERQNDPVTLLRVGEAPDDCLLRPTTFSATTYRGADRVLVRPYCKSALKRISAQVQITDIDEQPDQDAGE